MFWKTLVSTFLLSLLLSVDDLVVGVTYGLQRSVIHLKPLAAMVLGSTISMTAAMLVAKVATAPLSHPMADYLSAALLGGLGCWTLFKAWRGNRTGDTGGARHERREREGGQEGRLRSRLTLWESLYLGFALGVDDFAEAVGLAVAGFPISLTVACFKISEVVAVYAGIYLGLFGLARLVTRRLVYVPGLTLLAVAAWQVLQ